MSTMLLANNGTNGKCSVLKVRLFKIRMSRVKIFGSETIKQNKQFGNLILDLIENNQHINPEWKKMSFQIFFFKLT